MQRDVWHPCCSSVLARLTSRTPVLIARCLQLPQLPVQYQPDQRADTVCAVQRPLNLAWGQGRSATANGAVVVRLDSSSSSLVSDTPGGHSEKSGLLRQRPTSSGSMPVAITHEEMTFALDSDMRSELTPRRAPTRETSDSANLPAPTESRNSVDTASTSRVRRVAQQLLNEAPVQRYAAMQQASDATSVAAVPQHPFLQQRVARWQPGVRGGAGTGVAAPSQGGTLVQAAPAAADPGFASSAPPLCASRRGLSMQAVLGGPARESIFTSIPPPNGSFRGSTKSHSQRSHGRVRSMAVGRLGLDVHRFLCLFVAVHTLMC
jgi:hypothetical protein